jgi:chromosome segregation ATPase
MDKAKKELKQKLVDKFNIDFTHPEYISGDKQLFYALFVESCDEYEGSQKECTSLKITIDELRGFNTNQMNQIDSSKKVIQDLEEVKTGQKHTIDDLNKQLHAEKCENDSLKQGVSDYEALKRRHISKIHSLEEELVKVRSTVDKLTKQQAEDQNALALAHEEIQGIKEVAAEWEHKSKSVRKIPLLGTKTLSYQSDLLLRWKDHMEQWNDLVSDFQNKYLPVSKEAINSFITRVKNVEI